MAAAPTPSAAAFHIFDETDSLLERRIGAQGPRGWISVGMCGVCVRVCVRVCVLAWEGV